MVDLNRTSPRRPEGVSSPVNRSPRRSAFALAGIASLLSTAILLAAAGRDETSPAPSSAEPSPGGDAAEVPAAAAGSPPAAEEAVPRRVHLFIDRLTEIGGVVLEESVDSIVIDDGERSRSFLKALLLRIVPLVDPVPGQQGIVRMRDGTEFRATILEDAFEGVRYEAAGIRTFVPRQSVLQVVLEESDEERYLRIRETIPRDDHLRRLALCRWLFDRRMYEECREELRGLLADHDLGEARRLLTMVEAQLALGEPADDGGSGRPRAGDGSGGGPVHLRDLLPQRLLTREDVNLIRVFEIDFDRPPRLQVSPATIRRLIEEHGSDPRIPATSEGRTRMFRADPVDLVRLMFDLRARDLYSEVEVLSEPFALNLFRQRVHDAWLIGNCATSRCHGGVRAGRFFLHRRNHRDERVRFTNLLILLRSGWSEQPLVDFERPRDSLIIQHALPRSEARFPHPNVPGWRPLFSNANQRLLADSLRWIESMHRPRTEYPVEFEPPRIGTPPASGPAGGGDAPAADPSGDR